jgi:hypothetical protein
MDSKKEEAECSILKTDNINFDNFNEDNEK